MPVAGDTALHHVAELGVILVAAGRGERLGASEPKAFVELGGASLLTHGIRTVTSLPHPGQLVLVVPDGHAGEALALADELVPEGLLWQVSVVPGGRERHESVRFGLDALHDTIRTVLVHDAARPLTPASVFERVLNRVHQTGEAVVPGVPVADTLKQIDANGTVVSTVDRASLIAVQTPQGFTLEGLAAAHESAQARATVSDVAGAPTDDAEVVQRFGGTVHTVAGDPLAHKVTTQADLVMLEGTLLHAEANGFAPRSGRHSATPQGRAAK
ncbi:2-C-methyl-D-erythritol 4-phosphate cytidylyltransferase [Leucobacter sp. W1153]|uniref:2-C-methyl-D-erythritol 4-phosphate cytidylyltransferase n=1 Tax=Leucobacter sp. W1153 TaxID=3439064 RepID=UPI003F40C929